MFKKEGQEACDLGQKTPISNTRAFRGGLLKKTLLGVSFYNCYFSSFKATLAMGSSLFFFQQTSGEHLSMYLKVT